MKLLDPTLDVVFKILFAAPRHESVLINFLTDVLRPEAPIKAVQVLNPDIPKEFAIERASILDIRVMLHDARLVNVEMQSQKHQAYRSRLLYYWARNFGAQLEKGEDYQALAMCAGIYVLDFSDLSGQIFS